MIEAEREDLWQSNSPCNIFTRLSHSFKLNLDETSFLWNEVKLNVIWNDERTHDEKYCSDLRFSITALWIWIAVGVNRPVILLVNWNLVHPRFGGSNLVTCYIFPE